VIAYSMTYKNQHTPACITHGAIIGLYADALCGFFHA